MQRVGTSRFESRKYSDQIEAVPGRHYWLWFVQSCTRYCFAKDFCGTLQYAAPKVFPGLSDGHGLKVDVWSLGVISLEWIYDLSTLPASPKPRRKQESITTSQWYDWVADWTALLLKRLKDEDEDQLIAILSHMIKVSAGKRWPTNKCLALGFENGLFKRRRIDGLVVCMDDSYDPIVPVEEENEGTQIPTAAPSSLSSWMLHATPQSVWLCLIRFIWKDEHM